LKVYNSLWQTHSRGIRDLQFLYFLVRITFNIISCIATISYVLWTKNLNTKHIKTESYRSRTSFQKTYRWICWKSSKNKNRFVSQQGFCIDYRINFNITSYDVEHNKDLKSMNNFFFAYSENESHSEDDVGNPKNLN
jgi:hypothetical protein